MPSVLKVLEEGETSIIEVEIYEGKYHQVKRMFEAVGKRVIFLMRISMGPLALDKSLEQGECRELTGDELNMVLDIL
jgi:16S rRNA pseudouridine516 synthase